MRRFVVAAFMAISAQSAIAADLPILRGSYSEPPPQRSRAAWEGFYVGAHAGYSSLDMDFTKSIQAMQRSVTRDTLLENIVPNWQLLGTTNVTTPSFGGFVGYNWQWDDAIIGIEANYTRFSPKTGASAGLMRRLVTNPAGSSPPSGHDYVYDLTLAGAASAQVNDLLSLRARGGYSAGLFMPYAFAGLTLALVNVERAATFRQEVYDRYTDPPTPPAVAPVPRYELVPGLTGTETRFESRKNLLTFGFNAGFGVEMLLAQNFLLRAEYEYVQLPLAIESVIQLHTGRVGAGFKF